MQKESAKLLAESLIPLLGFYWWDWSLHFIFLFYFLDWLAKEVLILLQTRAIQRTQGQLNPRMDRQRIFLSVSAFIAALFLTEALMMLREKDYDFTRSLLEFMRYSDMGIAQGYLLVPLIAISVYVEYKMNFLQQKAHLRLKASALWTLHLQKAVGRVAVLALGLLIQSLYSFNDAVLLWVALLLPYVLLQARAKNWIKN